MNRAISSRPNRAFHACACLLICAIALIPPLVRAAGSLQVESHPSSSALRLSRGYDGPVAKWKPPAPIAVTPREAQPDEPSAVAWHRAAVFAIDVLTRLQHHHTPDPLRGPPLG